MLYDAANRERALDSIKFNSEINMAIEITSASLAKILTPFITIIGKECTALIRGAKLKWETTTIVENLSKQILDLNTVKTMWSRDKGVLIDSFYFPSRVIDKYSELEINMLEELSKTSIIVEGIVGQGKSMLLRHTCNSLLRNEVIPIFIEMRMLSAERGLEDVILDFLDACGINGGWAIFSYLAVKGRTVLILDGFDEVPSEIISSVIFSIEQMRTKHSELRFIISSRPYHAAQNLPGFHVYSLKQLEEGDYEPFLRKIIPASVDRFSITDAISQAQESIKGIITTPLMLTLLVLVYKNEHEIPSTLPIFFDKLFNTVFTGHDRLKAGFRREHFSGLSESRVQNLFDAFCLTVMQLGGDRTIKSDVFKKAFNLALYYTPESKCEMEDFRRDIINTACLMLEEGLDDTTFLHKSIMEYHAASFVKNAPDSTAQRFYKIAPANMWIWGTVLLFLRSIDSYRYGALYVMTEYPCETEKLTDLLTVRTSNALVKYLDGMFPNFHVVMSNLSVSSISSGIDRHFPFTLAIQELLSDSIFEAVDKADSKTIQQAIRQSPQAANVGTLTIGIRSVVENLDMTGVWLGLSKIEHSMIDELHKFNLLISVEQSKCHVFDLL